jgi:hypothetical protein
VGRKENNARLNSFSGIENPAVMERFFNLAFSFVKGMTTGRSAPSSKAKKSKRTYLRWL